MDVHNVKIRMIISKLNWLKPWGLGLGSWHTLIMNRQAPSRQINENLNIMET